MQQFNFHRMLKKYWNNFISLIYPKVCYHCETPLVEGEEIICLRCYRDFPLLYYHIQQPNPLLDMSSGVAKIRGAFGLMKLNTDGIAQKLLYELKYRGNIEVGLLLGECFYNHLYKNLQLAKIDSVIPVPIHRDKKRKRGYNQSDIIGKGICDLNKMELLDRVLIRKRNIGSQTKKGKVERWLNVNDLYEVKDPNQLKGRTVLLLDDVITTGATITMAAELLATTEVKAIYLGCIATGK